MESAVASEITLETFLDFPEDGLYREVRRGHLREFPPNATPHDKWHSKVEASIAALLLNWLDTQPLMTGEIHSGDVGCILRQAPLTVVGIDVAYFDYNVANDDSSETAFIDGPPILAVEILSPSDTIEDITEKVEDYLAAGVALVWIVSPKFRTVEVHRPDADPQLFNVQQTLSADPALLGFSTPVRAIFE